MAYITAEEARNLTNSNMSRLKEHVYAQIKKFAKSGRNQVSIDVNKMLFNIGEVDMLIENLTSDGFKVKRIDGMRGDVDINISW